jgi:hypothetical protein
MRTESVTSKIILKVEKYGPQTIDAGRVIIYGTRWTTVIFPLAFGMRQETRGGSNKMSKLKQTSSKSTIELF